MEEKEIDPISYVGLFRECEVITEQDLRGAIVNLEHILSHASPWQWLVQYRLAVQIDTLWDLLEIINAKAKDRK